MFGLFKKRKASSSSSSDTKPGSNSDTLDPRLVTQQVNILDIPTVQLSEDLEKLKGIDAKIAAAKGTNPSLHKQSELPKDQQVQQALEIKNPFRGE